jgi:hypothetical protein
VALICVLATLGETARAMLRAISSELRPLTLSIELCAEMSIMFQALFIDRYSCRAVPADYSSNEPRPQHNVHVEIKSTASDVPASMMLRHIS